MKISRSLSCALLVFSSAAFTDSARADDNCKYAIEGLKAQFPAPQYVVITTSCFGKNAEDADNWATVVDRLSVVSEGAIPISIACGHREVADWLHGLPLVSWPTYLDYCAGYKGSAPMVDPAKAEALKKQLEESRGKLKQ